MGLFMALSSALGAKAEDLERVLEAYVKGEGGVFEPVSEVKPDDTEWAAVWEDGGNATFLYPTYFCFWDDASAHLSKELGVSVFSFHIDDGDLWMFVLFEDGKETAWFNPVPGYWEELSEEERRKWAGDAEAVATRLPDVSAETLAPYFVEWDDAVMAEYPGRKAFPDDEFPTGDCWQLLDFMKRARLPYPLNHDGSPRGRTWRVVLQAKRSSVRKASSLGSSKRPKKPWWKFW